ncbi:DUF2062 domain-containing protein [Pseudoalteromonas xiamenensis]|uniref:DUF2062 domain-containing protein n=1 Tax=Pseudoalteromonas xiamenensis TaxID=882626 RepID=UPI0027E5571C|nr:DUF2062 domain-containing protein [Pseudoalteromonas xiamenensis]WMN59905.1 DUF2062 domain-containing protein [Pseudoalteromonas xiamenensis]
MAKKTIQRLMPDHSKIKEQKALKIFGSLLHDANLWHLNRRSARGAFAVGLFFAFIPVPFQMVLAAALAIPLRVNLPLSIALVWLTNPLTMPPIFYGAYLVGVAVLGHEQQPFQFEASWQWLTESISTIGPAFIVGCLVCATVSSIVGYFGIDYLWRRSVNKAWAERTKK